MIQINLSNIFQVFLDEGQDKASDSLLVLYKRHCDNKALLTLDGTVDALKVTFKSY